MKPTILGSLAVMLALPAMCQAGHITVTVDTSLLMGAVGAPYYVAFQLADGSVAGDGNNAVVVNNFKGALVAPMNTAGSVSGDLSSSLNLTDLGAYSRFYQALTPANTLSFDVTYTSNPDPITPDEFVMVILDRNLNILPTSGGYALLQIDFDAANPTVQSFGGLATNPFGYGAIPIPIPAPVFSQAATLKSIAVTPVTPFLTKGLTQQFAATGTFSDNSTQNLTGSVTWTSSTSAVASIAAGGLAIGVGSGTSTISAVSGGVSGSTVLTVTAPAQVAIPNVVGATQAGAAAAITGAGLLAGTVTQQSSGTVPSGSVISESPSAGTTVPVGSAVDLVISTGPPPVQVPNVVGFSQATATATITSAGLVLGTITQQTSSIVFTGNVISESPLAGTLVNQGTAVNLVISSGVGIVAVPNVVGKTDADAAAAILNAGLVEASASQVYTNQGFYSGLKNLLLQAVPGTTQNLVINLAGDPAGWDSLQLGISSTGPASFGSSTISGTAGVALAANPANIPAILPLTLGDPYPNNPAIISGSVILWGNGMTGGFSDGEQYAAMMFGTQQGGPYFRGWIHFKVQNSTLPTATLTVVDWAYNVVGAPELSMGQIPLRDVPVGNIVSESPAAGTLVPAGSGVNLSVSAGPMPVVVPNVVGQTQAAASTAVLTAGLVIGTVTQQSSTTVPSGSVISESPVAGTTVTISSAVSLLISTGPPQVAVPNVVGSAQAAATTAITSAGLVLGTVTEQQSSTVAAGNVISESPVAGTLVTPGSAVNLVVSSGAGQVGPPPAFVQVNHNEISAGSSVAVKFGAATHAGNTIVVYAIWDNAGSASVTDTRGDNFVSVSPPVTWGNGYSAQVFYATNIAGGTDTVTTAFKTAVSAFGVAYAHEYSGINASNPVDVIASASGSSKLLNSGAATTTAANDLIFGAGVSDNLVSAAGSGFTARDLSYGNITEDRTAPSAGSYSATATHNGQKWGMQMVAFRAAVGVGTVAAPTFTPPAGSYTSAQSVKLTTATSGASVYYTTDGTNPTTASTLYTVPISVKSSLTIKAIGHLSGMTDSPVVSAAYQITGTGTAPPSFVQVNHNQISAGSSVPVNLNLPAKPGNAIVVYAIWDNSGPASVTDSQGNHFVSVSAPVSWGNGYSAQIFYSAGIAGGAETVNVAFQTPTQAFGVVYAHEYSGIDTHNPVDATASANGSSSTLNSGSAATTTANDLIFAAGVSDSTVTAAGPGFSARDLTYGNITEDQTGASIGSYLATATHNGQQWGMQLVAFRPAP